MGYGELQVLARVYMARSDVGLQVRAAALHVWKTVVSNTPKMLAEILPALMDQLIASLASSGELCSAAALPGSIWLACAGRHWRRGEWISLVMG